MERVHRYFSVETPEDTMQEFVVRFSDLSWADVHSILARSYQAYAYVTAEQTQETRREAQREYNLLLDLAVHAQRQDVRQGMREYPTREKLRHATHHILQRYPDIFRNSTARKNVKINNKMTARSPLREFYEPAGDVSADAYDFLNTHKATLPCTYAKVHAELCRGYEEVIDKTR